MSSSIHSALANPPTHKSTVELLAPAGDWQCARAAIENGADAIYFGLDVGFNARARATNFHLDDLPSLMDQLHRRNVRGYVTLNTLVFTDELSRLEENVRALAAAGVDAVIMQDLGAVRLVRRLCPQLTIHASTQMTLTNVAAIEQVRQLGIARVVLARELSIREISRITSSTEMPIEVFVHGALCVAYSGQCLTSESLGGRSANRGQCAQACRLPYDLICDGQHRDLGSAKYLLSPQDLAAYDLVPQLIEAGVRSLKIEGRLKTAEYVANACQHYRRAIDSALQGSHQPLGEDQQRELEMSFSRGFSPGWLQGCDHKRLVPADSSAKRGVLVGKLVEQRGQRVTLELNAPLAAGDGLVFAGDRLAGKEIGGRVFELWQHGQRVDCAKNGRIQISMQHGLLDGVALPINSNVFKTDDPQLFKRLRRSFDSADVTRRVPVDVHLQIAVGQPIRMVVQVDSITNASDPSTNVKQVEIVHAFCPEIARKHPIDLQTLREQFDRLGGSVYQLRDLTASILGQPMVPLSILGELRREMLDQLQKVASTSALPCEPRPVSSIMLQAIRELPPVQSNSTLRIKTDLDDLIQANGEIKGDNFARKGLPKLRVLCRSIQQVQQVLECGVQFVIADLHDIREYRQAIELAVEHGAQIELATLRIHKPGEDGLLHALRKISNQPSGPIGWLARHLSALSYARQNQIPAAADFSLNVTNPLTAQQLLLWGASRITASYDLNREQLIELIQTGLTDCWEVVIHQHIPMFHMEHCVFCSVISPGKNKSDCGRPCDRHDVKLRDRVGAEHVLHADIGCRNTLYNATAQSGAEAVAKLLQLGVSQFRIELLRDSQVEQTRRLVQLYTNLIAGHILGSKVWQELKADNRIGVTRGTLEQPRNPLAIL